MSDTFKYTSKAAALQYPEGKYITGRFKGCHRLCHTKLGGGKYAIWRCGSPCFQGTGTKLCPACEMRRENASFAEYNVKRFV